MLLVQILYVKKKKNISILKLHINFYFEITSRNDAAMEDWFVTTSQIHVFNIYFVELTIEAQLK